MLVVCPMRKVRRCADSSLILSIGRPCVQKRLPGSREWKARVKEAKERHGAAGVPSEERRVSPIVELSLLLVSSLRPLCHRSACCWSRPVICVCT